MGCDPSALRARAILLAIPAILVVAGSASGLIMIIPGDQPWQNNSTPEGSEALANLPGRLGGWEGPPFGGGQFHFSYECADTEEFNEALAVFAKIRAPRLELYVHDGPGRDFMLDPRQGEERRGLVIDWRFTVWIPESFHRLHNDPRSHFIHGPEFHRQPVPAPRIDLYVHDKGGVEWSEIRVPGGIQVVDRRASAAPVKPEGGSVVQASVWDMATGRPIPDAVLTVVASSATSQPEQSIRAAGDEGGRVTLKNIPAGAFQVYVEAPGYAPRAHWWLNDSIPTYHGADVALSSAAMVSGKVIDDQGRPLKGVTVIADPVLGIDGRPYGWYQGYDVPAAETDDDGHFRIYPLPRGYAGLRCGSESYHAPLVPLMAVPAENVEIKATGTGAVRGRVTFSEGQRRPDEIHISMNPPGDPVGKWSGSMRCGEDGIFEFRRVPPGEYFLQVPGRLPGGDGGQGVRVTVKSGRTVVVDVPYLSAP